MSGMTDKHHGETAEYWWNRYVQTVAERDALQDRLDALEGRRAMSFREAARNVGMSSLASGRQMLMNQPTPWWQV